MLVTINLNVVVLWQFHFLNYIDRAYSYFSTYLRFMFLHLVLLFVCHICTGNTYCYTTPIFEIFLSSLPYHKTSGSTNSMVRLSDPPVFLGFPRFLGICPQQPLLMSFYVRQQKGSGSKFPLFNLLSNKKLWFTLYQFCTPLRNLNLQRTMCTPNIWKTFVFEQLNSHLQYSMKTISHLSPGCYNITTILHNNLTAIL